jgi:hypothetical protein
LRRSENRRQACQEFRFDPEMSTRRRRFTCAHCIDRCAAADSATGRRDEVPLQRAQVDSFFPSKHNLHRVTRGASIWPKAVRDSSNIIPSIDDAFRMKKPRSKLEIVAGRAHRDREHLAADPNLEGFFNR